MAAWLTSMDAPAHPLEVQDTLAELVPQLNKALALEDEGEIPGNEAMCRVACDSAYLMAAVLDPKRGMDMTTLAQGAQRAALALLAQLRGVGLMECYAISDGRFGY